MSSLNLTAYSREQLEHLLKMMKSYRNWLKQIGKRAHLSDPDHPTPIQAVVEYNPTMETKDVTEYALACIRYAFPAYTGASPILKANNELKWGARVFVGDDMVDISFQKFESLLKV